MRALTEPVILWDYVNRIILPRPQLLNVFNDHVIVQERLWGRSLIAIIAWVSCIVLAWAQRNRAPFLIFGLCWFLGGHALESTVLGLELSFEHRNYIPSLGLVFIVVSIAFALYSRAAKKKSGLFSVCKMASVLVLVAFSLNNLAVLRVESNSWGSNESFVSSAVADRPDSLRAWAEMMTYQAGKGDMEAASRVLYYVDSQWPNYPAVPVMKLLLHCADPKVVVPEQAEMLRRLRSGRFDRALSDSLKQLFNAKSSGYCAGLTWDDYRLLIENALMNPKVSGTIEQNIIVLLAFSFAVEERYAEAAHALEREEESKSDPKYLLLKLRYYLKAGEYERSLELIDTARSANEYWRYGPSILREVDLLESAIREKMK